MYAIMILSCIVLVYFVFIWLRKLNGKRNRNAVQSALSDYEEIIGGLLWKGKEAEVMATDRMDDPREPGPIEFEHICRMQSGRWFLFRVHVSCGRILFRELQPCDEATAKLRLEKHREVYEQCFGQPTIA